MLQEVPTSDVVVRNPTHFAVALRYEKDLFAPKVVAKGQDELALKIIAIAEEHGVPVHEDRSLARFMHDEVKVGGFIPPELFQAVAGILSELDTFRRKIDF
jgi:flagellar biosynthetic protein FlhB